MYAEGTTVPPTKSQAEIQRTVEKYGAGSFMMGWQQDKAVIAFIINERQVRFTLELPSDPKEFSKPGRRNTGQLENAMNAEIRRRWRCLAFVVKAKLETVATGITTFEEEFGMHLVMPDGTTVGDHIIPVVIKAIEERRMPTTLLAIES